MSQTGQRSSRVTVMVGTRKGAFLFHGDPSRHQWRLDGPHFLGSIVYHLALDPRDGRTLLMAAGTGHLGPTIFRSIDWGRNWTEAGSPPAFPKAAAGAPGSQDGNNKPRAVDHVFHLTPGHATQPGVWWASTSPPGLFRSEDGGATWKGIHGFNDGVVPEISHTIGPVPGGPIAHSVLVDPHDPAHLYVGISTGGIFESKDSGATWRPLNKGVAADFIPTPDPEYGHDPHCIVLHPTLPSRLYHQNHCGLYRLDRPGDTWVRIGRNLPPEIGDIGFPIVVHPRDPDTVWVIPMDGTTVWPRTSVGGRPAVYRSADAGSSWERQDDGLPREHAWLTIKRQAFSADACDPVGLYFGTTGGELWMSATQGDSWRLIAQHLPEIYAVSAGMVAV